MMTKTITLELPEALVDLLGPPERLTSNVREILVLSLLRAAEITQGQAAKLLGVTRYDILDLMVLHRIPSGPETVEELRQEVERALPFVRAQMTSARGQRQ
jgi:hypothetical protein